METFFGQEAGDGSAREFVRLMWRERERMSQFLKWAKERQHEERKRR
jgi:hypothetical protein